VANLNSARYIFLFAAAVSVACALLVSTAAVTLQPLQKANARQYMEKNVLVAAGLVKPGQEVTRQEVERFFQAAVKVRLVDFASGTLVPEDRINARDYDQRAARNDPGLSRAVPENQAGVGRIPNYGVVYFVMKAGQIDQLVVAVEGLGMWGTVYGFLSLDRDAVTVRGLTYYEHKETPGLGGEIGNPVWLALWRGRKAFDDVWCACLTVIKGSAGPPAVDPLRVDGITGATITSNAITHLMRFWLSDTGYGIFLKRFRIGEIKGAIR
jgi:Na+-transporting NADH:ubiquinone oxidoreductase subunit C